MKSLGKITLFGICVLFNATAFAQDSTQNVFSLIEAQDYALKNSYAIKNAELDVDVAKKTVVSYTSTGLPQISASGDFQNFIDVPTSVIPAESFGGPPGQFRAVQFGTNYTVKGGVQVSQLIFSGTYFIGLKAAKTYLISAKQQLEKSEMDIKESVAQAYYTALVAEENNDILTQNKINIEQTLAETTALQQNGFVEEQDVEQLELLLTNIVNSIAYAKRQVVVARDALKMQLGLPIDQEIKLSDNLSSLIEAAQNPELAIQELNVSSHIDYKLMTTQENLMGLNHRVEQSKLWPSLGGFFSHERNAMRDEFNFFDSQKWYPTTLWGISLKVPLFTGFKTISEVKIAKYRLLQAKNNKNQLEQGLKLKVKTARADYSTAIDQYQNQVKNLALAEKIKGKVQAKYNEGVASSMELTQAQNQYLSTHGNYINSIFSLLSAKSRLDKALNNK